MMPNQCSMLRIIASMLLLIMVTAVSAAAPTLVAPDVTEDATEANSQPKIGVDAPGKIYITFVKTAGGYSQIFVASSTDGQRWDIQQVTRARAHARYPALAVGPDNTMHLAWTQYDNGVGKVYYARYANRGWSTPLKISPGDAYAGIPALAVDAQGTVHMVWYGIRAGAPAITTRHGSIYEILYTAASDNRLRPASNGAGWREPKVISPGIPDAINPALVIDSTGRLHSAWYQFDLRNYQVRHTLRPASTGAGVYDRAWTLPETISSGRADAMAVTLAAGPAGTAVVAWERRDSGSRIYFAERSQRWSGQQLISASSQNGFNPSVAIDGRGRVYVAWDDGGQIYLRRRDGAWRETNRVTREAKSTHPIIAAVKDKVLVMWTQQVGDATRLRVATVEGTSVAPPRSRLPWGVVIAGLLVGYYLLWAALQRRRTRPRA